MGRAALCILTVALLSACAPRNGGAGDWIYEPSIDGSFTRETRAFGLRIVSTERVSERGHREMLRILEGMQSANPRVFDVLKNAAQFKIIIKRQDESYFDFPEYGPIFAWITSVGEDRVRGGIGPTDVVPYATVSEDNLARLASDLYSEESVALHEFAHALAWRPTLTNFRQRLNAAFAATQSANRWANTYARSNAEEYWAEAVQSYFECNTHRTTPDGVHGPISTRSALCSYDTAVCGLIGDVFGNPGWHF